MTAKGAPHFAIPPHEPYSLKGGYIRDYIGYSIGVITGDTRSLDYNPYDPLHNPIYSSFHFIFHVLFHLILHY